MSTSRSKRPEPFLARIQERVRLNPGSEKETYHIVLDVTGSRVRYEVGDCVGIYPENDPCDVDPLVEELGDESVRTFLLQKANLCRIPKSLLGDHPDLLTALKHRRLSSAHLQQTLLPLLPRFYSIASSRHYVGDHELHLIVSLHGVCSRYLCHRAPLGAPVVPLFLKSSPHFCLPRESVNRPLIMVGPGTGIAPFRGFMQERVHAQNWLFFGERHARTDFYYRSFWEHLVSQQQLRIDCAFSRDQPEKVYVQHKMWACAPQIWAWLQEGAYLFVCGDASKMAKEVDHVLHRIVETEGALSPDEAKQYITSLKSAKRYQRDVY